MHHLSGIADVQVVTPASSIMDQHPALQPSKSRRTANRLNSSDLVALGKIFLSEIELPRPHVIADGWYGSVSAPSRERVLTSPWPTEDITSLYILAHEIAHWNMHFEWVPAGFWLGRAEIPSYRKEYEAEFFAHNMLRRYGIAVPRQETIDARENVRYNLCEDISRQTPRLRFLLAAHAPLPGPIRSLVKHLSLTGRALSFIMRLVQNCFGSSKTCGHSRLLCVDNVKGG